MAIPAKVNQIEDVHLSSRHSTKIPDHSMILIEYNPSPKGPNHQLELEDRKLQLQGACKCTRSRYCRTNFTYGLRRGTLWKKLPSSVVAQ